jgi:hypothetical protein
VTSRVLGYQCLGENNYNCLPNIKDLFYLEDKNVAAAGSIETLERFYQTTWLRIPEFYDTNIHRERSLI